MDIQPKDGRGCEGASACATGFFSWDHIFEPVAFWATGPEKETGFKTLKELPARFDFFKKHESQF